jgi:eukaryotic-like serine/threonine-protein kinase
MSAPADDAPRIGNRYRLDQRIGAGAMGVVWRGTDELLNRTVAVKELLSAAEPPTAAGGDALEESRQRLMREGRIGARLQHPHVISMFDVVVHEDRPWLVMEYLPSQSLAAMLTEKGPLEPRVVAEIGRQVADGLAAAHAAGVVHRDVKPGNVLMGTDGVVKITDFGIAWSASSVPLTGTGQVVGTAHYLSPEQAAGGKATPASDVYALGTVAYECLAGRRAFDGENSVQIALKQIREEPLPLPSDVPAGMRDLVQRAMAKDPAERYPDGAGLHTAAETLTLTAGTAPIPAVGSHGTLVMAPRVPGAAAVRQFRRPAAMLLGALAAVVVLAVVVGLLRADTGSPSGAASASGRTSEATTSAPSPPPTVAVAAAGLTSRPVAEVQAELLGRGLQVQLAAVETADVGAGQVTAVSPEGELAPGTVVTLSYAVPPVAVPAPAPAPAPAGNSGPGNNGNGNGNNGNGHGNGRK